jgi:hypothetical protein
MDTILPLPVIGQYKQKTRCCHTSSAAAADFLVSSNYTRVFDGFGLELSFRLTDAFLECMHGIVRLFFVDNERRAEPQRRIS